MINNTSTYSSQLQNAIMDFSQKTILLFMIYYLVLIIGIRSTYLDKNNKYRRILTNNIGLSNRKSYIYIIFFRNLII